MNGIKKGFCCLAAGILMLALLCSVLLNHAGSKQVLAETMNSETLVDFDVEGISAEFVQYGSDDFIFEVPKSSTGKTFLGWFYNGIQYTDSKGISIKSWNIIEQEITMNAKWQNAEFSLQCSIQGKIYYYSTLNGWTQNSGSKCIVGETLQRGALQIQEDFKNAINIDNYVLNYFTLNDSVFQLAENKMPYLGAEEVFVLTPNLIKEIHTIYFDANGGTVNYNSIDVESGANISNELSEVKCSREGYVFERWEIIESSDNSDLIGTNLGLVMEDCTKNQKNGSIKVKAIWNAKSYKLSYVLNGGINNTANPDTFDSTSAFALFAPYREHYTFCGWFTDENFNTKITGVYKYSQDLTVYAKWEAVIYTVKLFKDGRTSVIGSGSYGTEFILTKYTATGFYNRYNDNNRIYYGGDIYRIYGDRTLSFEWISTDISGGYKIRVTEARITDDGRMKNPYDKISLYTLCGYNVPELIKDDYKTVKITVTLDAKEINDGYQYLFLYKGSENNAELIQEIKFEHGSGYKDTNFKNYSFTFNKINLSSLSSSFLYIRYGASGNGEDDWVNKNIRVSAVFSQIP